MEGAEFFIILLLVAIGIFLQCFLANKIFQSRMMYKKIEEVLQNNVLHQTVNFYYEKVNTIIDYANQNRDKIVAREKQERIDDLISQLFENTVNKIDKVKSLDSEEWNVIENFISHIQAEVERIVKDNQMILDYYESSDFQKITFIE